PKCSVVGHKKAQKAQKEKFLFCDFCAFLWLKPELDEAVEDDLEGDFEESDEEEGDEGRNYRADQILQRERQLAYFINICSNGVIISSRRKIRSGEHLLFRLAPGAQPLRFKLVSQTSCERAILKNPAPLRLAKFSHKHRQRPGKND